MKRIALALAACLGLGVLQGMATATEQLAVPITTAQWQPASQGDHGVTIEPVGHRRYYGSYYRPYYGRSYYRPYYSYYRPYSSYYRPS